MKKKLIVDGAPPSLTKAQTVQLEALKSRIPDTVDIPEAPAKSWSDTRRFYKPRKEPISIRLDADVLDWLRRKTERYQVEINRILRNAMDAELSG